MLRRITAGVIIVCMVLSLAGCVNPVKLVMDWFDGGEETGEEPGIGTQFQEQEDTIHPVNVRMRDTLLYYRDDKGYLVPVSIDIEWEEGIARAALERIIQDDLDSRLAQDTGLYSAIPEGTGILGLTIRDGLAKIDLSQHALNCSSAEEEDLMVMSVVYTLTEFNTVDMVEFMFEGNKVESLQFGRNVGSPISRGNINLLDSAAGPRVTVYFQRKNDRGFEYFVPVTLNAGTAGNGMDVAVKCLLEGPPGSSGLMSAIPEGVRINGMGVKNGIAYLNFEKGIFDYQGGESVAENIVKSIALTLKEYPSVSGVVFLVDGQPASLPSGVLLESVIDVPVFANTYN